MQDEFNNQDAVKVFMIDRDGDFETKSKDVLEIKFDFALSAKHFSETWHGKAAVYRVRNLTKIEKGKPSEIYTVEFYRAKSGEFILSSCDCVARIRCKHIVKAWLVHSEAEKTGFLPEI